MKPIVIQRLLFTLILVILLGACAATSQQQTSANSDNPASDAKNVILFIGDGMGVSTVTAIRILDGQMKGMSGEENVLPFETFPNVALSKTYGVNLQVAESAGTATAIMSGEKTKAGFVGVGPDADPGECKEALDDSPPSVLALAELKGKSTGVISTARLSHATPASTYAHVTRRWWESDVELSDTARQEGCLDVAAQLLDFSYGNGIEVAMGGGREKFLPSDIPDPELGDIEEGRQDGRNLPQEWLDKYASSAYVWDLAGFDAVDPASTDHLLGLFNSSHMQYEADRAEDIAGEPSLAEMTRKAIEILRRNPNGFFLLVEAGRIDHGHHEGSAYQALHDGVALANAVALADQMTSASDTLIIVTADHSHPFTIGGYAARGNPILGKSVTLDQQGEPKSDYDLAKDGKPFTTVGYQTGPGAEWVQNGVARPDLTDIDTVNDKHFKQQATIPKSSGAHGGEDVAVYAQGPGATNIHGVMEQNEIFHVMVKAAGLASEKRP